MCDARIEFGLAEIHESLREHLRQVSSGDGKLTALSRNDRMSLTVLNTRCLIRLRNRRVHGVSTMAETNVPDSRADRHQTCNSERWSAGSISKRCPPPFPMSYGHGAPRATVFSVE